MISIRKILCWLLIGLCILGIYTAKTTLDATLFLAMGWSIYGFLSEEADE